MQTIQPEKKLKIEKNDLHSEGVPGFRFYQRSRLRDTVPIICCTYVAKF